MLYFFITYRFLNEGMCVAIEKTKYDRKINRKLVDEEDFQSDCKFGHLKKIAYKILRFYVLNEDFRRGLRFSNSFFFFFHFSFF